MRYRGCKGGRFGQIWFEKEEGIVPIQLASKTESMKLLTECLSSDQKKAPHLETQFRIFSIQAGLVLNQRVVNPVNRWSKVVNSDDEYITNSKTIAEVRSSL